MKSKLYDKEVERFTKGKKVSMLRRNIFSNWYDKVEKVFESKIKKRNNAYYDKIRNLLSDRVKELEKNGLQLLFPIASPDEKKNDKGEEILDTTFTTKVIEMDDDDELSVLFENLYLFPVKPILDVVEGMAYGALYTLFDPKQFVDELVFDNVKQMMILKREKEKGIKEETKEYDLTLNYWENIAKLLHNAIYYYSSSSLEHGDDSSSSPIKTKMDYNDNDKEEEKEEEEEEEENYAREIWEAFRATIICCCCNYYYYYYYDEITKTDSHTEKIFLYFDQYNSPKNVTHLCMNILHFAVVFIKYTFPEIDNRIHRQLIRRLICNSFIIQFDVFKLRYSLSMGDEIDRHLKNDALKLITQEEFETQDSILRMFHITNNITDIISFESNFDILLRILPSVIKPRECNEDYSITRGRNKVYKIVSVIENYPTTGALNENDEKKEKSLHPPPPPPQQQAQEQEREQQQYTIALGQKRGRKRRDEKDEEDEEYDDYDDNAHGKKTKLDYFEKFRKEKKSPTKQSTKFSVMPYEIYSRVESNIMDGNLNDYIQKLTNVIITRVDRGFSVRNAHESKDFFEKKTWDELNENGGKEEGMEKVFFSTGNNDDMDRIILIDHLYQCLALFQIIQCGQKNKIKSLDENEGIDTEFVNGCKQLIEELLTKFVMGVDDRKEEEKRRRRRRRGELDEEEKEREKYPLTNFVVKVINQSGWKCIPRSPRLTLAEIGVCVLSSIVGGDILDKMMKPSNLKRFFFLTEPSSI